LLRLREIWLGCRIGNCHHGSNGSDISNRRRSSVNSIHIVAIVWPPAGAPAMLMMAVKVMMPWAIPAIGMPIGVVIWSIWSVWSIWIRLGAQGV
jgi:hypothetical protein